ncbi:MAG: clan AA aspartic protease [Bacteroidetes bacterium]|nr:clan AA aspartic protease [Bacteroidota bacterium]
MKRTRIPLKLVHVDEQGYHIFVKALINGRVANLLVDTGASKTVFDTNRIQKFASVKTMVANDQISTGLGTNSMQSHTIELKRMKLGDLILNNAEIFLLDLSHVNETYVKLNYKPLDGVLGGDILKMYNAVINYKQQIVVLDYPT